MMDAIEIARRGDSTRYWMARVPGGAWGNLHEINSVFSDWWRWGASDQLVEAIGEGFVDLFDGAGEAEWLDGHQLSAFLVGELGFQQVDLLDGFIIRSASGWKLTAAGENE